MEEEYEVHNDAKRRTRNLSEKKRRDQFNILINELSTMICHNSRKIDKSTVLKSTISFLKNHNEVTVKSRIYDIHESWKPSYLSNEEFTYMVLEALEGFVMVFSVVGRIFYVSEGAASVLGHLPVDLVNKSLLDYTHENDRERIFNLLQNPSQSLNPKKPDEIREKGITFQCLFKRGHINVSDDVQHVVVQFTGYFRTYSGNIGRDFSCSQSQDSRMLFVCTGRSLFPNIIRDVSLIDTCRNEFTSRHSLEWKFLFLDHRAPPIIGYLPFEVLGTSGYDYYHFDDLEKVVTCHEALMQKGVLTSGYYRFLTKGHQWIWLQTHYFITYHQWNSKPEFIVCNNRIVNFAEVCKNGHEHAIDPSPTVNTQSPATAESVPDNETAAAVSPTITYNTENAETFSTFPPMAQESASAVSVASASITNATVNTQAHSSVSWPRQNTRASYGGSDTASMCGDDRSDNNRDSHHSNEEQNLVPQHGIGAQYLQAAPYVQGNPLEGRMNWKHEQLQDMIVRQQEELRRMKEQLFLARLGIFIPNQYLSLPENEGQSSNSTSLPNQHNNQFE